MCSSTVIGFADASRINSSRARREGPLKSVVKVSHVDGARFGVFLDAIFRSQPAAAVLGAVRIAGDSRHELARQVVEARIAFSQARERGTTKEGVNCRRVLRRFRGCDWRQAR